MIWLRPKSIIEQHQLDWQVDTYRWLLSNYGSRFNDGTYFLVKPQKEHFPDSCFSKDDVAINTFLRVKQYAGVMNWPCDLLPQEEDINPVVAPTVVVKNSPQGPSGTFSYSSGKALITYNPAQTGNVESLVATFAHELGHYLTAKCKKAPPGGWELWEPATDLTAVYMGFGIFMANSSFTFKQYTSVGTQGWSVQKQGYLTPSELLNALAIFVLLKKINPKHASKFLKPELRSRFQKAIKYLGSSNILEDIWPKRTNLRIVR